METLAALGRGTMAETLAARGMATHRAGDEPGVRGGSGEVGRDRVRA